MRNDISRNEFKCASSGCEILGGIICDGGDCRLCRVHNKSESDLYHDYMLSLLPSSVVNTRNGICFNSSYDGTVARFHSVDDAEKVFRNCMFYEIKYAPHEMYDLYPNFFRIKAYCSLGVPQILLGNGVESPLISVFGGGSVYAVSPVSKNVLIPKR